MKNKHSTIAERESLLHFQFISLSVRCNILLYIQIYSDILYTVNVTFIVIYLIICIPEY
jgi:hypothetical protein